MQRIFIILLTLVSCSHYQGHKKSYYSQKGQCILDYTVTYEHKAVPDWYSPPENFCQGDMMLPTPHAISVYPLKYEGKISQQKNISLEHSDSWFYVIWACYGPCSMMKDYKRFENN